MKRLALPLLTVVCLSCTTEHLTPLVSTPTPPKVTPVVLNGKRYGAGYDQGVLPISDARTGEKIRNITLYRYAENPQSVGPGEAVFIKSIKPIHQNRELLIENEEGHRFLFDLKTEKVREISRPCRLRITQARKTEGGWSVKAELSFQNRMDRDFILNRIAFGDTRRLMDSVFQIKDSNGASIPFQGLIAKGASPRDFIRLAPLQERQAAISLSESYAFPKSGGKFTVQYRSVNRSSPDSIELISNPVELVLE